MFDATYERPALLLFDAHLDSPLACFLVEASLRSDHVRGVGRLGRGFSVTPKEGVQARRPNSRSLAGAPGLI